MIISKEVLGIVRTIVVLVKTTISKSNPELVAMFRGVFGHHAFHLEAMYFCVNAGMCRVAVISVH